MIRLTRSRNNVDDEGGTLNVDTFASDGQKTLVVGQHRVDE